MAGLPNSSNALQQWHHLFEAQGGPRTPEASQHLQQLLRLGLPTRKHEDWKYTPLDALLNGRFVADEGASLSAEQRDALALPLDAWRLVFIDGRYHPQLSDDLAASGVEVSVDNQRQHLPDALQPEVFLHLTESLAQTVTRIRVPRNRRLDKPLLLMHITSGLDGDALLHFLGLPLDRLRPQGHIARLALQGADQAGQLRAHVVDGRGQAPQLVGPLVA